jgi:small subunit ribosomal protein S17
MAEKKGKEMAEEPETGAGQPPEADAAGGSADTPEPADTDAAPEGPAEPGAQAAPEGEPAGDAPAEPAPEPEPAAEAEAAPEPEPGPEPALAPEAGAEPAPEAEADSGGDQALAQAGEAPSPAEPLAPKERRRRARSRHGGDARPARSPEERHAERQAERGLKAARRHVRRLAERAKAAERRAAAPAPDRSEIGQLAPVHAPVEGKRRERTGVVVSDKAEKTITVRIDVARRHRRYEKIVRSSSTLHAHDENNEAHEGDVVRVIESRPLSRTKRWALVDVLERAR